MKYDKYQLESDKKLLLFEFVSVGPKGRIKKIVQYSETNLKDYYNLGFGDKNEKTGEINDSVITNNGNSQQVLATVASTVYAFHLQTNTLMHGFMQEAVTTFGQGYIECE